MKNLIALLVLATTAVAADPNSIPFEQADSGGKYKNKQLPTDAAAFALQLSSVIPTLSADNEFTGDNVFSGETSMNIITRPNLGNAINLGNSTLNDNTTQPSLNWGTNTLIGNWTGSGNLSVTGTATLPRIVSTGTAALNVITGTTATFTDPNDGDPIILSINPSRIRAAGDQSLGSYSQLDFDGVYVDDGLGNFVSVSAYSVYGSAGFGVGLDTGQLYADVITVDWANCTLAENTEGNITLDWANNTLYDQWTLRGDLLIGYSFFVTPVPLKATINICYDDIGTTDDVAGKVTLSSGVATIVSDKIDENGVIIFSRFSSSGTPTLGSPIATVASGSAAVSGAATDNSTYNWALIKLTPL